MDGFVFGGVYMKSFLVKGERLK